MLKSDLRDMVHVIPMPIDETYKVVHVHNKSAVSKELVIMTWINEKEYNTIKHNKDIKIERGNQIFYIDPDDVFCFGPIDFNEGSDDCRELETFNWFDNLVAKGVAIPAHYDYEKHECKSPIKSYMHTETFSIAKVCRYLHACLGKPEYTIIFSEIK